MNTLSTKSTQKAESYDFMTCSEAARMTRTSRQMWFVLVKDGVITNVRIGRRILLPRSEVLRLIKEGTRPRRDVDGNRAEQRLSEPVIGVRG